MAKTIYLNKDFQCFVKENTETVQSVETSCFDGKCTAFIEGHRFVPAGQSWTREDGVVFRGEMVAPFKDSRLLETVQNMYEQVQAGQEAQNSQIAYIGMMTEVM